MKKNIKKLKSGEHKPFAVRLIALAFRGWDNSTSELLVRIKVKVSQRHSDFLIIALLWPTIQNSYDNKNIKIKNLLLASYIKIWSIHHLKNELYSRLKTTRVWIKSAFSNIVSTEQRANAPASPHTFLMLPQTLLQFFDSLLWSPWSHTCFLQILVKFAQDEYHYRPSIRVNSFRRI